MVAWNRFGGQSCLMRSIRVSGVVTSRELRVLSACNTVLDYMVLVRGVLISFPGLYRALNI